MSGRRRDGCEPWTDLFWLLARRLPKAPKTPREILADVAQRQTRVLSAIAHFSRGEEAERANPANRDGVHAHMDTFLLAARSEAVQQILAAAHAPPATAPSADETAPASNVRSRPQARREPRCLKSFDFFNSHFVRVQNLP